jgi:hypothetical protein
LLERLRAGDPFDTAVRLARLEPHRCHIWAASGRAWSPSLKRLGPHRRPFVDFAVAVDRARAECESEMLGVVRAAALADSPTSWRAALALLSFTPPEPRPAEAPIEDADDEEIARLSRPVLVTDDD